MKLRTFLRDATPPAMLRVSKRVLTRYGYSGNYASWEEARAESGGYDSDVILNKVKDALLKVKNGEAIYERDSVLFDKIEYSWPLLAGLLWIASQNDNRLNIIDFGGSLGSSYFQNRGFLNHLRELCWNIVEQRKFVECGKRYFEDDHLKFYFDIDECRREQHPDAILLLGVIQYLEKPYVLLEKILSLGFDVVIFDRTPFLKKGDDRISIQKVPPAIYDASYPVWFFNEKKFIDFFRGDYELVVDFDALAGQIDIKGGFKGTPAFEKGFIFKKKV